MKNIIVYYCPSAIGYQRSVKLDDYQRGLLKEILNDNEIHEFKTDIDYGIEEILKDNAIDAIIIDKSAIESTAMMKFHEKYPDIKIIFRVATFSPEKNTSMFIRFELCKHYKNIRIFEYDCEGFPKPDPTHRRVRNPFIDEILETMKIR